jgi:hypothetical protein
MFLAVNLSQTVPAIEEKTGSGSETAYLQIRIAADEIVAVRNRLPAAAVELEFDESVLIDRIRGRVGAVLTNLRFLAISTRSPDWLELVLDIKEAFSGTVNLSERMGLLLTADRATGFDEGARALVTYDMPLGEEVRARDTARDVVAFATARRAVVMVRGDGRFRSIEFEVAETFRGLAVTTGLVSVETSERLLTFKTSSKTWSTRPLQSIEY